MLWQARHNTERNICDDRYHGQMVMKKQAAAQSGFRYYVKADYDIENAVTGSRIAGPPSGGSHIANALRLPACSLPPCTGPPYFTH